MSSLSCEGKEPSQHSLPSYQLTRLGLPPYSQVISKSNLDEGPKLLQDQPIHFNMQSLQYIDVDVAPQRVRLKVAQPLMITPNSYLKLTIFLFVLLSIIAPHTLPCMTIALVLSYKSHCASKVGRFVKGKYYGWSALFFDVLSILISIVAIMAAAILLYLYQPWRASDYRNCYYPYDQENNRYNYSGPFYCS
ncbi:PREDICTED: uncharacterized protein LOC109581434 [Amphimedon queenslandica]|uniref:Uncharacterized protein n=1 Tax=Amphimedon queenslandica TaxID=400682 RepID=A0A1X7V1X4_AMPQE|nr:PREDICTED: uncharacterized protein LOC109581434 [Amphimedon queenslandica]|eukprot:XP_019851094.1 PREDICTED: uncharacterized protein LOC109581434 [Amphimedon queenslandica]